MLERLNDKLGRKELGTSEVYTIEGKNVEVRVGEFWRHYKAAEEDDGYMIRGLFKLLINPIADRGEGILIKNKLTGEFSIVPLEYNKTKIEDVFSNPEFEIVTLLNEPYEVRMQISPEFQGQSNLDFVLYKRTGENIFWLRPAQEFLGKVNDESGNTLAEARFKRITWD